MNNSGEDWEGAIIATPWPGTTGTTHWYRESHGSSGRRLFINSCALVLLRAVAVYRMTFQIEMKRHANSLSTLTNSSY